MNAPESPTISRDELERRIHQVGLVRMYVCFPIWGLLLLGLAVVVPLIKPLIGELGVLVGFFASLLLSVWAVTELYCRRQVRCPTCDQSLWDCSNGKFKVHRLRLREDARQCPSCHTPFR